MKKNIVAVFLLSFTTLSAQNERIIFLHHSTGQLAYRNSAMADSFKVYNEKHGTNYSITERAFPDKPYTWNNYPYDYWKIWLDGYCEANKKDERYPAVACLDDLTAQYNTIVLKHCYPGADILEDTGKPDISSNRKSLENYKLQYRALRAKFAQYPDNHFVVWTLVPRHRLVANAPANAWRAKEFVDWVKNEWLTEEGKTYKNIHIFDYFALSAELDEKAVAPRVPYTLRHEYELRHDDDDSHPNALGSKIFGIAFYEFLIKNLQARKS